jgi:hypothetical protein
LGRIRPRRLGIFPIERTTCSSVPLPLLYLTC